MGVVQKKSLRHSVCEFGPTSLSVRARSCCSAPGRQEQSTSLRQPIHPHVAQQRIRRKLVNPTSQDYRSGGLRAETLNSTGKSPSPIPEIRLGSRARSASGLPTASLGAWARYADMALLDQQSVSKSLEELHSTIHRSVEGSLATTRYTRGPEEQSGSKSSSLLPDTFDFTSLLTGHKKPPLLREAPTPRALPHHSVPGRRLRGRLPPWEPQKQDPLTINTTSHIYTFLTLILSCL